VGDANVADAMRVHAADIGAEPSGHVLFADGLPTGCGLLAGLRTLAETLGRGRDLDAALADYRPTFQAHAVAPRQPLDVLAGPIAALEADGARVVARPSGTEPVVRLMVEHADEARARGGLDTLLSILGAST
jgi:phosphoglucosamine mutase